MKPTAGDYRIIVKWSAEPGDLCFIARVREFEHLATHGDTKEEAGEELRFLLSEVLAELHATGEHIPPPMED